MTGSPDAELGFTVDLAQIQCPCDSLVCSLPRAAILQADHEIAEAISAIHKNIQQKRNRISTFRNSLKGQRTFPDLNKFPQASLAPNGAYASCINGGQGGWY